MEKTRIKITYAFEDESGFQIPDLMIIKEWYDDETGIIEFAKCLYIEEEQVSNLYHEGIILKQAEVNMLNACKQYLKKGEKINAVKHYKNYMNCDLRTAYNFITDLVYPDGNLREE